MWTSKALQVITKFVPYKAFKVSCIKLSYQGDVRQNRMGCGFILSFTSTKQLRTGDFRIRFASDLITLRKRYVALSLNLKRDVKGRSYKSTKDTAILRGKVPVTWLNTPQFSPSISYFSHVESNVNSDSVLDVHRVNKAANPSFWGRMPPFRCHWLEKEWFLLEADCFVLE